MVGYVHVTLEKRLKLIGGPLGYRCHYVPTDPSPLSPAALLISDQSKGRKLGVLFLVDICVEKGFITGLDKDILNSRWPYIVIIIYLAIFHVGNRECWFAFEARSHTEEARTITLPQNRHGHPNRARTNQNRHGTLIRFGCNYNPHRGSVTRESVSNLITRPGRVR